MTLLGIHGFKLAGKDTVGAFIHDILVESRQARIRRLAFADAIKKMAAALTGIPLEVFYDRDLKDVYLPEYGVVPRTVLTDLYDALLPKFGKGMFVTPVRRVWDGRKTMGFDTMILTDVRYDVEADWIRSQGGLVVHVLRPGVRSGTHSSEHGIRREARDYVIINGGSLEDLRVECRRLVDGLFVQLTA